MNRACINYNFILKNVKKFNYILCYENNINKIKEVKNTHK